MFENSTTNTYPIVFAKQLTVSFLLGTLPLILSVKFNSTDKESILNIFNSILVNELTQKYLIVIASIYIVFEVILYWFLISQSTKSVIIHIKDIFKEVASGVKSTLKIFAGVVFGFIYLWPSIEPESLSFSNFLIIIVFALIYLATVSYIEIKHDEYTK